MRNVIPIFIVYLGFSLQPASAALVSVNVTLLTGTSPVSGNDKIADMNSFLDSLGKDDTGLLGKISSSLSAESKDLSPIETYFTVKFGSNGTDKTTGTIDFDMTGSGKTFDFITLKSASQFAVYEVDGTPTMGQILFSTLSATLTNTHGNAQDISHISFFGLDGPSTELPIPAAGLLFPAGLLLFAGAKHAAARRRNG